MPTVDGLTPMEASDLAHEESSHIAKRLANRAQADGKNVIWDITMAKTGSIAERVESLRAADTPRLMASSSISRWRSAFGGQMRATAKGMTSSGPGMDSAAGMCRRQRS